MRYDEANLRAVWEKLFYLLEVANRIENFFWRCSSVGQGRKYLSSYVATRLAIRVISLPYGDKRHRCCKSPFRKESAIESRYNGQVTIPCPDSIIRRQEIIMAPKSKENYKKPKKIYWHLYSLQSLNPEKFIKVIDKILRHEFQVIK
jgi:hypothetical protein